MACGNRSHQVCFRRFPGEVRDAWPTDDARGRIIELSGVGRQGPDFQSAALYLLY